MLRNFWKIVKERFEQASYDDDDYFVETAKPVKQSKINKSTNSNKAIITCAIIAIVLLLLILLFNDIVALASGCDNFGCMAMIKNSPLSQKFDILFNGLS
ncbi:MAG: hypothetical protein LBK26_01100 [Rickettsiales bacterium]|jgi:hypothetical protein|nr:hypothetical protein [Rickettsiales bacterium]